MGQSKSYILSDLSGGLNEGTHPTDINDNEMIQLVNWYPWSKRLRRRPGLKKVSEVAYKENLTGAFASKSGSGTWTLIVGGKTSWGKLDGDALVEIFNENGSFTTSEEHWSFAQYKDIVYGARDNVYSLQRCDGLYVGNAGIAAPTSAPTLAQGVAGNLGAGDYIGIVTFYNTETGAESNPSDNSNTLTLAASKKINWTGIPVSPSSQVDARRLYRTLADQDGAWYFVGQINDNVTTTYTDNVVQSEMGAQASFDNGLPPNNPKFIEVFQERLWTSDYTYLYFSELGLPESFSEYSVISVSPDDGHQIRGLLAFGDRLLIGKTKGVYYITGTDASTFQLRTLTDEHGVYSHHSMQAAEGIAMWFGGNNFYKTDGNTVIAIGDKNIRNVVDSINPLYYSRITSAINAGKSWYLTIIPVGSYWKVLVYNYRDDTWSIMTFTSANSHETSPEWIISFFDENDEHVMYCNLDDGEEDLVFAFDELTKTDNLRDIKCYLQTKRYGFEDEDILKFMKNIAVQAEPVAEYIKIGILNENGAVCGVGYKNMYLYGGPHWKRAPVANNGDPQCSMSIYIEHTGTNAVEPTGIQFVLVVLDRRVPVSELT